LEKCDEKLVELFSKDEPFADAFECLFENASDAIYILDKSGNFVTVNCEAEELTGFKREDLTGKSFRSIIPLKSLPKTTEGFLNAIRGKEVRLELELKTAAEKTFLAKVTSKPLIVKGKVIGTIVVARDITERVLMEKRLRETNKKLEMILETATEGITVVDSKENLTFVNKAFADILEYPENELIDVNLRKLVDEKNFKEIRRQTENRKKGNISRYELVVYGKGGKPHVVHVSASPLWNENGQFVGSLAIVMDVTEHKRMEEALRESEEKFRKIFEKANDSLIYLDKSGRIIDVNERAVQVFGGSKEELLEKHFIKAGIFSFRDIPRLLSNFARILRGKEGYTSLRITNKKGQEIYLECSSSISKINDKLVGILIIARDVTERKKMEEELRESKEKMRNIIESSPDAITVADLNGNIVDCNKATLDLFGHISRKEIIGKNGFKFVAEKDLERLKENIRKTLEYGSTKNIEYTIVAKDGHEFPIEISASTIRDASGHPKYFVAIFKDITERKRMQQKLEEYSQQLEALVEKRTRQLKEAHEQIIKSERLAAIGQVAAMIGHDLRNPLTGISGATYYLKTKLTVEMNEKNREMLELIEKNVEHANNIVTDLMEYSKETKLELTKTTPRSILKETLFLVEIPDDVQVRDLTQDEPKITVDSEQMKRVFANLIKNAVDAMPDGGRLTIASEESDGTIEMTFTDTGTGMTKEVMEKIWIPFFTTKAIGMGLGLPICKRIIEAHGGKISVESTFDKGTTFTVTIPVEPKLEGGEKVWVNLPESSLSMMTKA
jgi:two-component system, sporulation sensor kinase E